MEDGEEQGCIRRHPCRSFIGVLAKARAVAVIVGLYVFHGFRCHGFSNAESQVSKGDYNEGSGYEKLTGKEGGASKTKNNDIL